MRIHRPSRSAALLTAVLVLLPFATFVPVGPLVTAAEASSACTPTTATFVGDGTNGTTAGREYVFLTFSDAGDCDWQVPAGVESVDVLVVGGGGGGGGFEWAGGGGGGGVLHGEGVAVTPNTTVPIAVGDGGGAGSNDDGVDGRGGDGGSSAFDSVSAPGGGGGGGNGWNDADYDGAGVAGGSGGGGGEHGDGTAWRGALVYRVDVPTRDSAGAIVYAVDDRSTDFGTIDRITYRMQAEADGVDRYAEVTFDAWKSGLSASDLRVPDMASGNRFIVQEVVKNMVIDSNMPAIVGRSSGVTTSGTPGTLFTGYLELWPWNFVAARSNGIDSDGDPYPRAGTGLSTSTTLRAPGRATTGPSRSTT
jgi:hypothetical protein